MSSAESRKTFSNTMLFLVQSARNRLLSKRRGQYRKNVDMWKSDTRWNAERIVQSPSHAAQDRWM